MTVLFPPLQFGCLLFLLLVWLLWLGLPVLCWIRVVKVDIPVLFLIFFKKLFYCYSITVISISPPYHSLTSVVLQATFPKLPFLAAEFVPSREHCNVSQTRGGEPTHLPCLRACINQPVCLGRLKCPLLHVRYHYKAIVFVFF